ncbi:MAG: hypothetical protein EOO27_19510 [Comamonadaceae bacterium]|nr:MAG: hypothetical protein EOO27_19510 [Comamonadaceae bacterium]
MSQETTTALSGLLKPEGYQAQTAHLFPSEQSIRWYIRQHRDALVSAGALLYIAGRLWINSGKFDSYVLEAGARQKVAA